VHYQTYITKYRHYSFTITQDVGRHICEAVSPGFPFIGDADDGYGNAMNAKRTVRGYALAGFAGLLMEDQVAPKACGHTRNRRVLPRADAVARVKAACDERDEGRGGDLVIFARSDARSAESLEEALWRVQAFADAGADALFIDALRSREEMEAFCKVAPGVPKMANMLEGGGSTPICTPKELEDMGFKVVAYPLSLLACTVRAMENTLREIRDDGYPDENTMPSFEELKNTVGFPEYYVDEARYDTTHNAHVPRIPRE
jgi:2-methylisocitrate lyase-like PEP mutase family enzyme